MLHFKTILLGVLCAGIVTSKSIVKRDNEIYNKEDLVGKSVYLNGIPVIEQTLSFSCGPTIALSMLRYWGWKDRFADNRNRILNVFSVTGDASLDRIMNSMSTSYTPVLGGVTSTDFLGALNRRIISDALNDIRVYRRVILMPSPLNTNRNNIATTDYANERIYMRLVMEIYNSLVNRAPVAFAFNGRFSTSETVRGHFILIVGVEIAQDDVTFTAVDPDGGQIRRFGHDQLNNLLENGGLLFYHRPGDHYLQIPSKPEQPNNNHNGGGGAGASESSDSDSHCSKTLAISGTAGVTGGFLSGAIVGSAVPFIGTIIGGIAGATIGLITGTATSAAVAC